MPNETWISPHRNSEVISGWTVEKGQEYLAETGRIDGWWVSYKRGTNNVLLPQEVYDNVIIFSSVEGARLVVSKYDDRYVNEYYYDEIEDHKNIGDLSRVWIYKKVNSGGVNEVKYTISFAYRNIVHLIQVYGYENEVKLEDAEYLAEKLLNNLEQLPLSESVTFKP